MAKRQSKKQKPRNPHNQPKLCVKLKVAAVDREDQQNEFITHGIIIPDKWGKRNRW